MSDGGSMKGSGTLGWSFVADITCQMEMCGREYPSQDIETDDWGGYTFECPSCGYVSEFEAKEPEYEPENDRMEGDD